MNIFQKLPKTCSLLILVLIAAVIPAFPVNAEVKLSLNDCIELAFKNQPSIRAAKQNLNAGLGRETQARSAYFPQITARTGYSETWSASGAFGANTTKSYTTTVEATQLIYDFGKTGSSVDAARWSVRSRERELERIHQEVILNVKREYFALLAAKNLEEVALKRVEQTEFHLKQAQAFYAAGSKPRFEVTRAEVDVNTARLGLITATNDIRIRTIALNNAIGIDPGKDISIEEEIPPAPPVPVLEQAREDALGNRPELLKAEAEIEASRAMVESERANYFPVISANGAYNWAYGNIDLGEFQGMPLTADVGDSWNAGVMLSIPLFQGGLTRGRVMEARAALAAAEAQRDGVKQSVLLEVDQSYADMENARVRIDVMESSKQKAAESLALAQGRYQAGVGPFIEVSDAQLASVQADTDYIQAQYDYHLSIARLLRAMGKTQL